jgi:hypothetical protein
MKYILLGCACLFFFDTTHAAVRINEIAWSGTTESANDEWIELFNDGEKSVSLENWTLKSVDGSPDILLSGTIEPAGFFLLERTDDTSVPNMTAHQIFTGSLSNNGEEFLLLDSEGNPIDATPAGEWIAGSSSPERRSMMWTENGWKTFEGDANGSGIFGTPGAENATSFPPFQKIFVSGEPSLVRISELSPISIGEPEWIEIEIFSEYAIDLQNWKLRRGTSEVSLSSLILENGGQCLAGKRVNLPETGLVGNEELNGNDFLFPEDAFIWLSTNPETPLLFIGNPSPIGLPDDGGTLEIVNGKDEVVTTAHWEKTKSGTNDGIAWGEIWNWDETKYWPWRSFENNPTHTRGRENKTASAFPEQLTVRIDEIAPNRTDGIDFIEILIENVPENATLPPWNLKHNGTTLFSGEGEQIDSGERITLFLKSEFIAKDQSRWINRTISPDIKTETIWESSTKNGLNKTSGTLELNIWTGTSWEQTADFVCWTENELSETEQTRLESHLQDWNGSCFKSENFLPNESMARPVQSGDTNHSTDFFHHFNGSPQNANFPQNNPPIPKILIQGGKKVYETSLNITGLDGINATTDPDGNHDIKAWKWDIEGKSCGNYENDNWEWSVTRKGSKTCEEESRNPNPSLIYFNFQKKEKFKVTLVVEDFSGSTGEITVELNRDPFNMGGSGSNVFSAPLKKWIAKELGKEESSVKKGGEKIGKSSISNDHFFDEFLSQFDYTLIDPRWFKPQIPQEKTIEKFARDRIPKGINIQPRNIGDIFLY